MVTKKIKNSFFILLFCSIPVFILGQTQKKYVTEEKYEQWTSMSAASLSKDGKWAYYSLSNTHINGMTQPDTPTDTLELVEFKTLHKHIYPFGKNPQFAPNSQWFSFLQDNQWILFDLRKQTEKRLDSISFCQFVRNGEISLLKPQDKPDRLMVYNNQTGVSNAIDNIAEFELSPDKEQIAVLQQRDSIYNLLIIDLKKSNKTTVLKENLSQCSNFRWSDSGNLLAFYEQKTTDTMEYKDHILHCLNLKDRTLNKTLHTEQLMEEYYLNRHVITFTKDETVINFTAFPKDENYKPIDPLIWKSSDPVQPPVESTYDKRMVISWHLESDKLTPISDQAYFMGTGDYRYFFALDDKNYLPSFKYGNFYNDIVFINSETGKAKIIDNKFIVLDRQEVISVSPKENYLAWIKNKGWKVYDIQKDETICMTCKTNEEFSIPVDPENNLNVPYGTAVYSKDNANLILTSKHNVWIYNFKNKKIEPLFKNNIKYSYKIEAAQPEKLNSKGENYNLYKRPPIDLENGLFIIRYNLKSNDESLFLYQTGKNLKFITSTPHKISSPRMQKNTITYTLSNYDLPPQIVCWNNEKEILVKQSNKQQQNYYWGHSELLTYPGPYGTTLKGALFYPGNYDPKKKYPVMFKIYSDVSLKALKKYIPLTIQNSIGWNNAVFTTQDYFVFMPDITYKINYTGESALKSVLAGVDAITEIPGVDTKRMGLFGQSFGGYEVSYIATQTNKFKTIVSFAGWHDLVDTYLTTDDSRRFNYFRFEHNQLRIQAPFYSQMFLDNSPILLAYKVKTPMLLIAGTHDRRVDWKNSVKMQLALTRLGKESTLLLYKNENHVFIEKNNQTDITKKLLEWIDYHLKDKFNPKWNQ